METEKLIQAALDCGASKATVIPQEQVVTSAVFREICESNGCGNYGRCWMCPPDVGEIEPLMAKLREFRHGLLYQLIVPIEDSFDIEGMGEGARAHAQLCQRVQRAVRPLLSGEILHLSAGGCHLCETCAKVTNEPCRHPDKTLPPMECYGIDVYNTVKDTDLHYINGQNTVTFFGLVLFTEAENG